MQVKSSLTKDIFNGTLASLPPRLLFHGLCLHTSGEQIPDIPCTSRSKRFVAGVTTPSSSGFTARDERCRAHSSRGLVSNTPLTRVEIGGVSKDLLLSGWTASPSQPCQLQPAELWQSPVRDARCASQPATGLPPPPPWKEGCSGSASAQSAFQAPLPAEARPVLRRQAAALRAPKLRRLRRLPWLAWKCRSQQKA